MSPLLMFVCLLCGAVLPTQAAINAGLAGRTAGPLFGTFVNFTTGAVFLCLALIVLRVPWPSMASLTSVPAINWTGGLMGAFFVMSMMIVAPKLGAGLTIAVVVAGQIGSSMLFDHYGWLGYQVHEFNWGRFAGAVCLIAGVVLVQKY